MAFAKAFSAVPIFQATVLRTPNPNVVVHDIAAISATAFTFNVYTMPGGGLVSGYSVHWVARGIPAGP